MARRVAICAVAQIPFEANIWYKRVQVMCFEVVEQIMRRCNVDFDEKTGIQNIVTVSDDVFDARTISNNAVSDAVGAHYRAEEKIAMDGINAIGYAMACVLSGHDDNVLIVGHCKESQSESRNMCTNLATDPFYSRPVGLDYEVGSALQARAYMAKSGVTDAHLAKVVTRARKWSAKNPLAHAKEPLTEQDVLNSPMLCDPIRQLHAYPVSDGAVALLIASEETYKKYTDNPVWVTGFANCMDSYFLGDRDLASNHSLKNAAARAYKKAGVTDPSKEFDIVEVKDSYAYQLPMWSEGLGVCEEGAGGKWIDAGGMDKNNVNLSGGMLGGNPIMIGGLARAADAVLQLRGEAGERQVDGAKKAVAHGTIGAAGQFHSVLVLEKN